MEKKTPVVPFLVEYLCDNCGKDTVVYKQGASTATFVHMLGTQRFEHICNQCGHLHLLPRVYNYIDYEPLEKVEAFGGASAMMQFNNVKIRCTENGWQLEASEYIVDHLAFQEAYLLAVLVDGASNLSEDIRKVRSLVEQARKEGIPISTALLSSGALNTVKTEGEDPEAFRKNLDGLSMTGSLDTRKV
jgi:hypothetical protein